MSNRHWTVWPAYRTKISHETGLAKKSTNQQGATIQTEGRHVNGTPAKIPVLKIIAGTSRAENKFMKYQHSQKSNTSEQVL